MLNDAQIGWNNLILNASDFSPGVYFYSVTTGDASVTKKMIVE